MPQIEGEYRATPQTVPDTGLQTVQIDNKGNLKVVLEENLSEATDSITSYPASCTMTAVDLSATPTTVVSANPAYLVGLYVNTAFSAHAVSICNTATPILVLPASLAAGTAIDCYSSTFSESLVIDPNDSSTGELVVFWRAV